MLPEFEWLVWGFNHNEFNVKNGIYRAVCNKDDFEADFEILSPKSYTDDQYGLNIVPSIIEQYKPDFVITSMDYDRVVGAILNELKQLQFAQGFKWINYFPMDREDFKNLEVNSYRYADVNVCITKFGQEKIKSINPRVRVEQIYHPIDVADFPQVKNKEIENFKRKTFAKIENTNFLIGSINRSFSRKDTPRLVRVLSEYLAENENARAYIHGARTTNEGMDLLKLAIETEAPKGAMYFPPDNFSEIIGISGGDLNKIYRSLDLFLTVSSGEGFGFTTAEALLTKTPIIAPRNTSFPELIQDFGYLVEPSDMAFHHNSNTSMWPIVNVQDVKDKIKYVQDNYEEAKAKAEAGSQWVKDNLNLDVIAAQWREILK